MLISFKLAFLKNMELKIWLKKNTIIKKNNF